MLYLGIDQHRKQLTVSIRNEEGDVVVRRQVSTAWDRVRSFLGEIVDRAGTEGYVAILEVCGFNDWLIKLLAEYRCRQTVLIQPEKQSKRKTDSRDAHALSELLWVNRQRLLEGKRVRGVRRIHPPTAEEASNRQLTALRMRMGQVRTRVINKLKHVLRRHNLEQSCPTKGLDTRKGRAWLASLELPWMDRMELDILAVQWSQSDNQIEALDKMIQRRQAVDATALLLATIPGCGAYSTLALASRIGAIERFPRPESLANYWGLTPGCRNSGEVTDRLGSITKQGSKVARFLLGQLVLHVLRRDGAMRAWYLRIKKRRGSKIARVAVMRQLTMIIWHMVKHRQPYAVGGLPKRKLAGPKAGAA